LLKRLQEVNLSPEDGQGLQERLERGDWSAADRQMLAKVVRATQASQQLLEESIRPAQTTPQRKTKRKRQFAKASRRRNWR
jgi:hypothetical protein